MMQFRRCIFLSVLLVSFLTTGCNFQLRGNNALPTSLRMMYLKTSVPYSDFLANLRQNLKVLGVCITSSEKNAPITLHILKERFQENRITISATSLLSQYLLLYEVTYQLENQAGCRIMGPRVVIITRNYTVNANQVLGAGNEIPLLQQDMHREAAYQIINQLNSGEAIPCTHRN